MSYARVEPSDDGRWIIKPVNVFGMETFKTKGAADRIATCLNVAYAMGRESAWRDLRSLMGAAREDE